MNKYGQTPIGIKDGMVVYVSDEAPAQKGEREVREQLGLIRRYPVKTDLSGNVVMAEGDSHEDAVQRYLSRTVKPHNVVNHRTAKAQLLTVRWIGMLEIRPEKANKLLVHRRQFGLFIFLLRHRMPIDSSRLINQ